MSNTLHSPQNTQTMLDEIEDFEARLSALQTANNDISQASINLPNPLLTTNTPHLLQSLRAAFSGKLLSDTLDTEPYLIDWRKSYHGAALAVVEPDTTADVAAVVRWCIEHNFNVVPQGGNTSLSGGSVPDTTGNAVLLSLKRLNRVRAIDPNNNTMTVEAGCILQDVQTSALSAQRLFPLSLAAQGSCTIGGNLATNAGGVQVLRYGNARELCLGLEVVTAQGEIWDGLKGLRKDNTGYDLRDLYIGSEGTLGVITAAVLKLYPLPAAKQAAWIAVQSPALALRLLSLAQQQLGAALTAFELVSDVCLSLVLKHFSACSHPLPTTVNHAPWYLLLEISDAVSQAHAADSLQDLLQTVFEQGLILDAALSDNEAQFKALWALRENISEAQALEGKNIKHDIAVPISSIPSFIDYTQQALYAAFPHVRLVTFGHMGDGNLHYNVSCTAGEYAHDFLNQQEAINRIVHDAVARFNGSISAEHGLGVLRRDEAARYKSPVEKAIMRSIKRALDAGNRMNPGKVLVV
jgi:FAD/FMN-containing dehydrogenase